MRYQKPLLGQILQTTKGLIRSDIPQMLNVKAPSGMASLAFVFDTTGSMWDDLEKVLFQTLTENYSLLKLRCSD